MIKDLHNKHASVQSSRVRVTMQLEELQEDEASTIALLRRLLDSKGASIAMQDFVNGVIARCTSSESGIISLTRSGGSGKLLCTNKKRDRGS